MSDVLIKGYIQSLQIAFNRLVDLMWENEEDKDKFKDKNDYKIRMAHYFANCVEEAVNEEGG